MKTEARAVIESPSPTQASKAGGQVGQTTLPESTLDQRFNDAYRLKLAGRPIKEIADHFKVDRVTIWRWCKQVEGEALQQIADEPVFNLIVRGVARLNDIEEQARDAALKTKSDRAKVMFLGEARRAAISRHNLLITTGFFPKAPEQIFRVTASMKPHEMDVGEAGPLRDRKETIGELIEAMQRGRSI